LENGLANWGKGGYAAQDDDENKQQCCKHPGPSGRKGKVKNGSGEVRKRFWLTIGGGNGGRELWFEA